MEGFEPPASCSQSRRATNCATPGYYVVSSGWADSPKPPALPTALYPDTVILFFPVCGHLCGQSGFWARFAGGENPANARVARGSGLWLFPSWIDGGTLPKQARYQLRYTRLFSYLSGWAVTPKVAPYQLGYTRILILKDRCPNRWDGRDTAETGRGNS